MKIFKTGLLHLVHKEEDIIQAYEIVSERQRGSREAFQHTNKTGFKGSKREVVQSKDVLFTGTLQLLSEKRNIIRTIFKILAKEVSDSIARPKKNWSLTA